MTSPALRTSAHKILAACLGLSTVFLLMASAEAVDARVRSACMGDYFAYCSQHDPDGSGVRRCVRTNGRKLSPACLNALIAAGELSKKQVRGARLPRGNLSGPHNVSASIRTRHDKAGEAARETGCPALGVHREAGRQAHE